MRDEATRGRELTGAALLAALALLSGCGGETTASDGGLDAAPDAGPCTSDEACDDGLFCNGPERCVAGSPGADARGCAAGEPPCPSTCDEARRECDGECDEADADGDGHRWIGCGGDDCDDDDPLRHPGNLEVCDVADRDEDCDPATFGVRDGDDDGFADARCCNVTSSGARNCGEDCDDTRPYVFPGQLEECNGYDDDCDGTIDEEVESRFTIDADGDGFGSDAAGAAEVWACRAPAGYGPPTDCDDGDLIVRPTAPERCDPPGRDEDCDGTVDPPELCDCVGSSTRPCATAVGACAAGVETCAAGRWTPCSIEGTTEVCNEIDDDCDGATDEGVAIRCFDDPDRDGYAAVGALETIECACPFGTTPQAPVGAAVDCREGDAASHPEATELCDRIDNDCSSGGGVEASEDEDGDGHAPSGAACAGGPLPRDDCHDGEVAVHPGQTSYIATSYCPAGLVRCGICVGGGVPACRPPGCACTPEGSAPSFDYDCNGIETRRPSDGAECFDGTGVLCSIDSDCGTNGLAYDGTPPCGSSVDVFACSCGTGRACRSRTMSVPLGCR